MTDGRRSAPMGALLGVVAVLLTGCAATAAVRGEHGGGPLQVVATSNFVADTARELGGERVRVTGLMGAGVDPHLYRPRPSDVETLAGADLVVANGLGFEGKMAGVFAALAERGTPIVAMSEAIPPERLLTTEGAAEPDPHTWFDPARWGHAAAAVTAALRRADPSGAVYYDARLTDFARRLAELDRYARERLAAVPRHSRVLVTSHDAFGYFADAYGFTLAPVQGLSVAGEATTADVERVAAVLAEREVEAVFVESSVPRRTVDAVRAAASRRGWTSRVGGQLYSDNAGDAGTTEGTYMGALRHNIDLIADGLR